MRALALAVLLASAGFGPHEDALVVARGRPARTTRTVEPVELAGWHAIRDRDTGVPLRMWGGVVDAPGAVRDPAVAERFARAFLVAHLDLLAPGAAAGDFVLAANQLDGDVRTVGFRQTWRGLPVVGGQLGFVFAHDHLFAIGSEALPEVRAALPRRHAVTAARAEAWIAAQTGRAATTRAIGDHVILPIVHGFADIEYHVADVLDVEAPGGRWDVYVDEDGAPLARKSTIATATGTLTYNAGARYGSGVRKDFPAPNANITVDATATTTAADGSFAWTGTAPATVVPGLVGTYVRIDNQLGPAATTSLTAQPGQPVAWNAATVDTDDAQLSTYIYANIAKARARIVNPAVASWLDTPMDFFVNEAGTCNAYSTPNEVHLYVAGGGCENTGRVADVVFHEFGHTLHAHSIIAGMGAFEIGMAEGLADFNAANITEDPGVGRGFYVDDSPMRDIAPDGYARHFPDDVDYDPHLTGEIISGALWDLRKALVRSLGHDAGVAATEKVFTGIMQRAADLPSTYIAALIADDNDGNLGNGTPHECAIDQAFGVHGLVPGFVGTTVGPAAVDNLAITVPVVAPPVGACPAPQVTSVTVTWQVGDGLANELPLAPGAAWTGALPPQREGTVVTYSVTAAFDDGSSVRLPNNPADPLYQTFVGTTTPIWCEPFDADPHWVQTGNLGDQWTWGRPGAVPYVEPPAAHSGDDAYGTNLAGNGHYRANQVTQTQTPDLAIPMYQQVHLQYWRWLTVEDALYDQASIVVAGTPVWHNASSRSGTLDHVDKEWRFQDVDVTSLVGAGTIDVQWTLSSDFSKQLGGWTLDDVCLVGLTKRAVCGDGQLDEGEQCDDGAANGKSGDACSTTCHLSLTAGGGGCSAGGGAGWLVGLLVIRPRRTSRRATRRV